MINCTLTTAFKYAHGNLRIKRYFQTMDLIVKGKATTEGTKSFVSQSNLSMHHHFYASELFINPIIHGPPKGSVESTNSFVDECMEKAVLVNRCNCLYVYNHSEDGVWYTSGLSSLLSKNLRREEIVTVAGLGFPDSFKTMAQRLRDATVLCGLEYIDMVIVECNDDTFSFHADELKETVRLLEKLVMDGFLHSYGLNISVKPGGIHMMLPPMLEDSLEGNMPSLELILYPICPTTMVPTTYPMLDDGSEESHPQSQSYESLSTTETNRLFTRGSVDPLLCYVGDDTEDIEDTDDTDATNPETGGTSSDVSESESETESSQLNRDICKIAVPLVSGVLDEEVEGALAAVLDQLCPPLASSHLLQDKALRAVLSVGVEVVVIDAVLSAAMGKVNLKPEDALTSDDTDELFGAFMIPPELLS
eukprot:gene6081-12271_t